MKLTKLGVLSLIIIIGMNACATTENTSVESISETSSIFPAWYEPVETVHDSLNYVAFATAIAADSVKAIDRAEIQARIHLEKKIAQLTEEIRIDLEASGSTSVSNTDFIIILRTAHFGVEAAAMPLQAISKKTEGYYRGFSSVQISKSDIKSVLEKGFTGHPRYWGEYSSSSMFLSYFE
ncbi:MAG: hypothetical protein RLN90_05430 [Balneolaceae bacterium]